jgi:DNA helicase-2/ATP-dependent DNA helicase PcrA
MTLAARVARLVLAGADPQRILLLTFSRRAALEMQRRVGGTLRVALGLGATRAAPALPWAGTFHSVGARLLRELAPAIGLSPSFTVADRADAQDLMGFVRHAQGLAATAARFPLKDTCLTIYSRAINAQLDVASAVRLHHPWCTGLEDELGGLFRAYVVEKQRQQTLDFDDLLLYWHQLMSEPTQARAIAARFDHVLVDEYQDTNRLQAAILRELVPDGRGLTVVGDDAQAIYAFRGAEVRNILEFAAQFTSPARVIALTCNYRSTQPILDASNAVIALAGVGHRKALHGGRTEAARPRLLVVADAAEQAHRVADAVLAQREAGVRLRQQAVLFRTAHHSTELELELRRRRIPFVKFGGLQFLDTAHVKDLLSVLRWVHNPRSRLAGFRAAQLIDGIGPNGARRLLDAMDAAPDPWQALRAFRPAAAAARAWRDWLSLADTLRAGAWPDEVSRVAAWLRPHLERTHDDASARAADLAQLARIAAGHASRERFLTELTLDPPQASSDEAAPPYRDEDYLILSTIHSAKGQEWQSVYVLHVVDGCIPSDMATGSADEIEEERRLLYVAMTRAKHQLTLLMPQRFYVTHQAPSGDRHLHALPSRFVPESVAALFDQGCGRAAAAGPEQGLQGDEGAAAAPAVDLPAKVRALF